MAALDFVRRSWPYQLVGAAVRSGTPVVVEVAKYDKYGRDLARVTDLNGTDISQALITAGLGVHYDLGEGHPLLGRRMPDLDLITTDGPRRVFSLLHEARPMLLDFGELPAVEIAPWADRVQSINAKYDGKWELPAIGAVTAPIGVLIRPDGYVAWVGEETAEGLIEALTTWFGPPA